jgi:ABC-2 type transport system permease protein
MSGHPGRRRFRAMLVKESLQIMRDPSTFLIAFALPMLLLFLFGYAISLDPTRTRIGLVLQDSSASAQSLAQAYENSRWFEVVGRRDVQSLGRDLSAGRIRGIVVIPQDFGRKLQIGGEPAPIQVITDGSNPNVASFVASYAEGVRASWAQRESGSVASNDQPLELLARYWFNPELDSHFFLIPGSIVIVMTMIGTLLTALVVAREWERGTMEAIMATPVTMTELLATKVIPYFLLGLISMTLCTLLAVFLFGVPFRGSPLALLAIASAFLVPALGQGLMISAVFKNQFVASQIALLSAFLPAMMLSGFLFEISSMPPIIRALTYLVPARYLIPPLQSVFLVGDLWSLFLRDAAIMLGFGAVFFAFALRATHRRMD